MARKAQPLFTLAMLVSAGGLIFGLLTLQNQTAINLPAKNAVPAIPDLTVPEEQPLLIEEVAEPVPLSEFEEMTLRPLFSASRRPPPAAGDQPVADTPQEIASVRAETGQFMVMGIVIAPDDKVALLKQQKNSSEVFHVKEGQKFSDWTVSEITPEAVTIQRSGVTDVVKLSDNVLSAAQKQKLVQQAKLKQAKTTNKQRLANRRIKAKNNRRTARQSPRRNNPKPQAANKNIPRRIIRKPTR